MNSKVPTPLEKLIIEKHRLSLQCRLQEELLNDEWEYIRQHARPLVISGLASIFSGNTETEKNAGVHPDCNGQKHTPDYFSMATEIMPVIWQLVKPLLINWSLSKIKEWARNYSVL